MVKLITLSQITDMQRGKTALKNPVQENFYAKSVENQHLCS